ncbi:hypothetical protein ABEW79_18880 [Delftia tsuruhatensis]|uniref:ParA family protein n=1 Tax=Delftia tsuruhatensis TaxID=180282 RepID=UPI003D20ACC5
MENREKSDLLSWFDVERRIAQCTNGMANMPAPILSASVYSDSVELVVTPRANKKKIMAALRSWFTEGELEEDDEGVRIILRIGEKASLLVEWTNETIGRKKVPELIPLWRRLAYASEDGGGSLKAPNPFEARPTMIAFHSFKGGVGRTTSLVAFAVARAMQLAQKGMRERILIIDADTEAPGVTYWLNRAERGNVSYVRLLEALHSPATTIEAVLDYFSREIQKNAVEIDGAQILILPAFVDQSDLLNAKVAPEHLVKAPNDAWVLGDFLHKLSALLDVDHTFIDLRAGLSELSSPILFDPRFNRFIVSTVAEQSVCGVELLLQTMRNVWASLTNSSGARHPYIILSMLTESLKSSADYLDIRERLEKAYGSPEFFSAKDGPETDTELLRSVLTFFEGSFSAELMAFRDIQHALSALKRSSLVDSASAWFSSREMKKPELSTDSIEQLDKYAKNLSETCRAKQFAENESPSDLLITEALRNLGRSFSVDLPNAVLIGAKGSGKTFSFLQISNSRNWGGFLRKIGVDSKSKKEVLVLPLLRSNELGDKNSSLVNECFELVQNRFVNLHAGESNDFKLSDIQDRIEKQRSTGARQLSDWVQFWTSVMARAIGVKADNLSELNQHISATELSVVFLFDGIEDVLRDVLSDDVQKAAIEAIIELPNRIRELRNPAIGVLAFVREDYAKAVKTQNFGQFQSRYGKFRLDWSPREFLQLILWLCADAGIDWANKQDVDNFDNEKLVEKLERLWGKKLGRDDAAEAYSARWVYAALSDLRGRLQARDAVRFLGYAAQQASAKRLAAWSDRVLPPSAIRGALLPTSVDKVQEARQEYAPLHEWMDKLVGIDGGKKKIPFVAEDLGLDGRLRQALQEIGVVYEDVEKEAADRLYVPEIYRHGLGLGSGAGARPRVQALLQRALGALPF